MVLVSVLMVFHGPRLVFHGFRSVLMVFHGPRLAFHGLRSILMVFHGPRLVFYGFRSVYDEVFVCLSVTKNKHFLLLVSCNHLNHPKPPCTTPS